MSSCVPINAPCSVYRTVGNLEPLGAQLLDVNGDPADIVGASFRFWAVDVLTGLSYVLNGSVVVDDVASARVSWIPAAGETDQPGTYACYFVETDSSEANRQWPYNAGALLMVIQPVV